MEERSRQPRRQRVAETSAGGFVLAADGSNTVALIGRETRGRRIDWCVPKGHPEGSETLEQAAIREVFEETGIEAEIILKLGSIDYEFTAGRKVIAKTVHQFLMKQTGGTLTVENDPNHEAVEARWVSVDDLNKMLSHENERRMARAVLEWVERSRA
jgi:8-oxo-dGTP pyrophosphatase MutT (NUDIX family)